MKKNGQKGVLDLKGVIGRPHDLSYGPSCAPTVQLGPLNSYGAVEVIVMSWYVAVNTFIHISDPQAEGSRETIFRLFGR